MKTIKLGSKVVVSDPCYTLDTWCMAIIENVLPGLYYVDTETMYGHTSVLLVTNINLPEMTWELIENEIGVDSGQAGIFDFDTYRDDSYDTGGDLIFGRDWRDKPGDDWYQRICGINDDPGTYDRGCVSSSGYGDGSYELELGKNSDGKVVGFRITFIKEGDDEWDDFEDDEEETEE